MGYFVRLPIPEFGADQGDVISVQLEAKDAVGSRDTAFNLHANIFRVRGDRPVVAPRYDRHPHPGLVTTATIDPGRLERALCLRVEVDRRRRKPVMSRAALCAS